VDLRSADLRGAHLQGANLSHVLFGGANLCAADLQQGSPLDGGPQRGKPRWGSINWDQPLTIRRSPKALSMARRFRDIKVNEPYQTAEPDHNSSRRYTNHRRQHQGRSNLFTCLLTTRRFAGSLTR
jgi:hypothetical protein